jgi:hypothetical protein
MSIRSTILLCGFARLLEGQPASQTSEPIIDVHVHADRSLDNLRRLERHSVVFAVLTSGAREDIWRKWVDSSQIEFVPALLFPNRFRTLAQAESAYADPGIFLADSSNRQAMFVFPDTAWLRSRLMAKTFLALGEMTSQYWGLAPTDPRLEAYFALAEEFDVPIGIHMALAPPDETTRRPTFRARFGNPLLLEDALVRHPKLRLYVMHAGYPFLEEMIALMTVYPAVYVDVSAINAPDIVPRADFHRYLKGLVEAGFSKRIMFGSDFTHEFEETLAAVTTATFLTPQQRRDILYNNAAAFFKLSADRLLAHKRRVGR